MDITIKAKCSTCTKEYTMGTQTHNYVYRDGRPMVGGACPWCGRYNTWLMKEKDVALYPGLYNYIDSKGNDVDVTEIPYHEHV